MGCLNLYIHDVEYVYHDMRGYHEGALALIKNFPQNPWGNLNEWFFQWPDIWGHANFFNPENAVYWRDVGRTMHTRFMLLSNFLSGGDKYTNVIFFNVIFFLGQLSLLKTFNRLFPGKKLFFLVLIFLLPLSAFWCSGMHKEGFTIAGIGFILLAGTNWKERKTFKSLFNLVIACLFLLMMRYFYFICLLPPLLLWIFSKENQRSLAYYGIMYVVLLVLFFGINSVFPSITPMDIVVNREVEFDRMKGGSKLSNIELESSLRGFVTNTPQAIHNVFLLPRSFKDSKYTIATLGMLANLLLIFFFLFNTRRKNLGNPISWFAIFASLSILVFIGFTISNLGALIRYQSVFFSLLFCGLLSLTNLKDENLTNLRSSK